MAQAKVKCACGCGKKFAQKRGKKFYSAACRNRVAQRQVRSRARLYSDLKAQEAGNGT